MTFVHHRDIWGGVSNFGPRGEQGLFIHTVDSDGNGLVKSITISTDEGWDLAELVDLQVFLRYTLLWLSVNDLKLDVIILSNCLDGIASGVTSISIEFSEWCHDCGFGNVGEVEKGRLRS